MLMAGQPQGQQLYPYHKVLFDEAGLSSLGLSTVLGGRGLAAIAAASTLSRSATRWGPGGYVAPQATRRPLSPFIM